MLSLQNKQTNNNKKAVGHKETFGSDGYVVIVSRGLAYVQNDKFVYIKCVYFGVYQLYLNKAV